MKVGTQIDGDVNAQEAAQLGGLDFEVELVPSGFVDGEGWHRVGTRHAVVRKDTREFFDYVSDDYRVVQYADAFSFMDRINPRFVAAGPLSGGKQGFIVVQLPGLDQLDVSPGGEPDPHELYVVLRTSHDRSKAIEVAVMPLRGRCMNQLPLPALTRGVEQSWSVKHIGRPEEKLAEAERTLVKTERYAEVFANKITQLASVRVTREDLRAITRRMLPDRPGRDAQVRAIEHLFTNGSTVGYYETGWGALNAVVDYFEWGRNEGTRTPQSRFTSGLQGDVKRYANRMSQLIMQRG
jgi:phage/plasmid-like protein (TIGR03299 family)